MARVPPSRRDRCGRRTWRRGLTRRATRRTRQRARPRTLQRRAGTSMPHASAGAAWRRRGQQRPAWPGNASVAVVVRLVGAVDGDTDVVGLVLRQLGELHAEGVEVQAGDLLVE